MERLCESEKDKNAKLIAIAQDKYKMDLAKIDNYMPRGPLFAEKVKALEKKLIKDALIEKKQLISSIRSKSVAI